MKNLPYAGCPSTRVPLRAAALVLAFASLAIAAHAAEPKGLIRLNDDGGWCWFEDERAIVTHGKLVFGTIAAGVRDSARRGDVEATSYDLKTGQLDRATLHRGASAADRKAWFDDHNSPALLVRPDGRLLAVYAQHGRENRIYHRISRSPGDATAWGDEKIFVPSETSRVTYSNLHWLPAENRIYDFFRGLHASNKPSFAFSEDSGESWRTGNIYIEVPAKFRHRPYVKYASNGRDTVHMVYTDGHPLHFDNSIYHIFYRAGKLHRSDGSVIRSIAEGLKAPEEGTRVFRGDPNNVGWTSDLHLDRDGHPYLTFSVQKDSAGLPQGQGGTDHRYHYARWDGHRWIDHEIARGGTRLYAGEDDYTGLVTLDPHDPATVFISTNVEPLRRESLPHREIFQGRTQDGGATWNWTPVTENSAVDNLRPIVPIWESRQRILLWLRGTMRKYTDYDFEVVGLLRER